MAQLTQTTTLEPELLQKMDAYWRAANYLAVGPVSYTHLDVYKRQG